jgi:3'(2'), 5'-bisphosphate nucleotidase
VAGDPGRDVIDSAVLARWSEALLPAVQAAGEAILEIRAKGFAVMNKADASPVTAADHAAEAIVLEALSKLAPAFPIVAEECVAAGAIPACKDAFWLVDALDGTKEFVKGGADFTVNVGFVWQCRPVFGIVGAPARNEIFAGFLDPTTGSREAFVVRKGARHAIAVRPRPAKIVVVGSKSHEVPALMEKFLGGVDVADRVAIGSSLKFCLVAEGKADLYPRFGPTSEWDTAAGDAVLNAAGGRMRTLEGGVFLYGKPNFRNAGFIADGGP